MAEFLVDSYSESNYDIDEQLYSGYVTKAGQSFTAKKGKLSSCKFYLRKSGNPTGNAVAKLYAHTGTYGTNSIPTGSALATSDDFDVSTLTTSYQLITFTFTGEQQYSLVDGTYYCIILEYSGGDVGNQLWAGTDTSSPTHSGNRMYYYIPAPGPGWYSGNDFVFYVYATTIPSGGILFFLSEAFERHKKLWTPKILLPKEGYSY